jgi:tRNA threonylcarbamoyladenosine biosynthesis protein TsaB
VAEVAGIHYNRSMTTPIILAIETSTDACSVAISMPDQIYSIFLVEPQAHSKLLLDMVAEVCTQAGVELGDLAAIAFGQGPGSFTGVRIAASVVQGLAFGAGKPVVPVSSLQALAQQGYNKSKNAQILAIVDARMQEIYWGAYKANVHGLVEAMGTDCVQKPGELIVDPALQFLAVGTGVTPYQATLQQHNPQLTFDLAVQHPRAQEVVQLAIDLFAQGAILPAGKAIPVYVRDDVAKKNPG